MAGRIVNVLRSASALVLASESYLRAVFVLVGAALALGIGRGEPHRPRGRGPAARRAGPVQRGDRAELFLGVETVKTHVRNVLAKLGARDRVQAVIMAYESGFIR